MQPHGSSRRRPSLLHWLTGAGFVVLLLWVQWKAVPAGGGSSATAGEKREVLGAGAKTVGRIARDRGDTSVLQDEPVAQVVSTTVQPKPTLEPTAVPRAALFATLRTPHGSIVFELLPSAAPQTVANFVRLVESGFYKDTTLYRYEAGFCLQGGAWPKKESPFPPVKLEYHLPNAKYFVSTARTSDPNSATSEFSIMLGDNSKWLGPGGSDPYGYAVFAKVVGGIDVIEKLGALKTEKKGLTLFVPPVPILDVTLSKSAS